MHDINACLPAPDRHDAKSLVFGLCKRLVPDLPRATEFERDAMLAFAERFFKLFFRPIDSSTDRSVEKWLESRNWPQSRKKQVLEAWLAGAGDYDYEIKAFIKAENYVTWKDPRFICPTNDYMKAKCGPIVSLIEEQVYALPCFVKKVPQKMKMDWIVQQLVGYCAAISCDISSCEATERDALFEMMERMDQLFTQDLPEGPEFVRDQGVLLGVIKMADGALLHVHERALRCDGITIMLSRHLNSGMMSTSVRTALKCAMVYLYLQEKKGGVRLEDVAGLPELRHLDAALTCTYTLPNMHEGDDALAAAERDAAVTAMDYASVGMKADPRVDFDISGTDFCSLVFDEFEKVAVTDVREAYVNFGWAGAEYAGCGPKRRRELVRAKSFSMLYQYPGCPILHELAMAGLRATHGVDLKRFFATKNHVSLYEMEQYYEAWKALKDVPLRHLAALSANCGMRTRLLVERLFGVAVEAQLRAEKELSMVNEIRPLAVLDPTCFPESWVQYNLLYVRHVDKRSEDFVLDLSPYPRVTREWINQHGGQFKLPAGQSVETFLGPIDEGCSLKPQVADNRSKKYGLTVKRSNERREPIPMIREGRPKRYGGLVVDKRCNRRE